MNLINFPMDKQKCYLNIEACKWYSIFLTVSCFPEIYRCLNVANQLFFVLLSQLRWPRVDPSMVSQKPCDGVRQNSDPQLHFDILWSLFRHWGLLNWYDIIFWRQKAFTHFITTILKSLVVPIIWLALIEAIYSRVAPFFALNRIIFPASEEGTLKTKRPIRFQGLYKVTNLIAGNWKTKSIVLPPKNGWI